MESAGRFRRRYVDSIMMKVRTVAGSPPYGNSIMGWAGSKLSCEKYSTCYSTVHSLATVARPLSAVCMYVQYPYGTWPSNGPTVQYYCTYPDMH
jgi:hypothetical protein